MAESSSCEWKDYSIDEIKADSKGAIAIGPFGSRMKSDCYVESGIPVIRGNSISGTKELTGNFVYITNKLADELSICNVFKGDLVFPHRGLIGEVGIITGNDKPRYVLSSSLMKLTCNKNIVDPLFLFYFFRSPIGRHELLKNASQVGTPGIATPLASLKSIHVLLPPLNEQRAIAHILSNLDDKIELNHCMNETLEAMTRAIFKSWFVDFDPVRTRAEGREPASMDAETAALFPDSFEETEMGMVPKGWKSGTVDDLCVSIENGGTPKRMKSEYWDGGTIQWFKTGELTDGPLMDSEEAITEKGLSSSSCKLWKKGTILIALYASPTVGRLGILEMSGTANQACSALMARSEFGNLFLFYTLLFSREELQNIAVGAAQQNISQQIVRHHNVLIPSPEIASAFQQKVERYYLTRVNNEKQSKIIATIRDALLSKLLIGEIRTEVQS